tara:strand:+ start:597 stop:1082 length:486 start_codon:yes stop_codon:yes gene_type:complete
MVKTKEEKKRICNKKYYQNNKEKIKELSQTPKGKMNQKISNWKNRGLICDSREEYEIIYKRWLNSTSCEKKGCEYTKDNIKCMDHEHHLGKYGPFRNILCNSCNVNDKVTNTSGTPNVYYDKINDRWSYARTINKILYQKWFKTQDDAIEYKYVFESTLDY